MGPVRNLGGLAWSAFAVTVGFSVATAAFGIADDGTRLPAVEGDEIKGPGELLFGVVERTVQPAHVSLCDERA